VFGLSAKVLYNMAKHDEHIDHETAVCRNPLIHNFNRTERKLGRTLIDQHLIKLCFYENIRRSIFFFVDQHLDMLCLLPKCLIMRESRFDEPCGLRQIAVS
jgi:hypothetical protein